MPLNIENLPWEFKQDPTNVITYIALFLIVFSLIYYSIRKTIFKDDQNKNLAIIISIAVTILGIFYLLETEILTIIRSYSTLGLVLTTVFPLIIIILLSHSIIDNPAIRKLIIGTYAFGYYFISKEARWTLPFWLIIGLTIGTIALDDELHNQFKK